MEVVGIIMCVALDPLGQLGKARSARALVVRDYCPDYDGGDLPARMYSK